MRLTLIAAASVLALAGQTAIAQPATTGSTAAPAGATTGTPGAATGTTGTASPPAAGMTGDRALAPNAVRGSRLIGADVENANGDDIGEINDVIIDPKSGQVQQVIVGVGGFLGIAEKDVALQWEQLRIQQEARRTATAPAPGAPGTAMAPGTSGTTPTTGVPATRPPATEQSTTAPGAGTGTAPRGIVATGGLRVIVNMTKEQLQNAPDFDYEENRAPTGSMAPAPAGGTTGTTR